MKLTQRNAPHIRHSDSNKTVMGDVLLTLLPLYVMAFCFYGWRPAMLMAVSVVTCTLADWLCVLIRGKAFNLRDFSPMVTGLIIPLLMPASSAYTMVVVAGLFAIVVVKQTFGGLGCNLFNPAAGGMAFAIACWPDRMFSYPLPFETVAVWGEVTCATANSTAYALKVGGVPTTDLSDMLLGIVQGPMGATNILVILACLLYLSYRKTVRLVQPLCFLGTASVMAVLFPRAAVEPLQSAAFELMSGSLIFGAVFLLCDPVTSPKRLPAKALYGAVAGVTAMLFRRFGGFEQTIVFAILFMNMLAPAFDWLTAWRERRGKLEAKEN